MTLFGAAAATGETVVESSARYSPLFLITAHLSSPESSSSPPLIFRPSIQELESMEGTSKPHLLLIPYPLQGHIIPAVHLAIKLAGAGFSVTFVNTEAVHHLIRSSGADGGHQDIFAGARSSSLDIRYELVGDGLPVTFDRSLNHDEFMLQLLDNFHGKIEALAGRLPPISGLVADTFFVWPATLARSLGIPYISFWTEPALVFSLYYHMDLLRHHGHFGAKEVVGTIVAFVDGDDSNVVRRRLYYEVVARPSSTGRQQIDENRQDTITYLPGVAAMEPTDLMSYLQDSDTSTVVHRIIFKSFEEAHRADFILANTVAELESDTIAALDREKPFYAVGPIFPAGFTRSAVATSLWAESDCSQWLDSRPRSSVLYISFGSYAHVEKRDLEEIAHGLMASGASFVWVLRPDVVSSNEPEPLPAKFRKETDGRGIVVRWCRQAEVLSHPAVGGFLTHCGWNSILESVWSGVPMLCFPLLTDQFTNRRLVVGDWKVAVDLGGGPGRMPVRREDVAKKIGWLMRGKEGVRAREEVRKMRGILQGALARGGSSSRNFDRFVEDLKCRVSSGGGDVRVRAGEK
ncbi:UDP-glycosyltransferase 86A2 [Platanthera guangdongensis]|uniref:Glycosyltransferase n=1 Tax=Platanthera guangdongensis TaxID=2320717 RepID=A0ABR2LQA1_9ASPA